MPVPTGDKIYGFSTGRVTLDLTNHLQRTVGRFITARAGDSTAPANRFVTKNSTSLGLLALFWAELGVQFTSRFSVAAKGSEQLPLRDQKIYTKRQRSLRSSPSTLFEPNGLTAIFDAVIGGNALFSSYYNRSVKPGGDSVSSGLTCSLRSYLPGKDITRDDLFR